MCEDEKLIISGVKRFAEYFGPFLFCLNYGLFAA
jgi:hypothetical protein